jgi:hypothetical protein
MKAPSATTWVIAAVAAFANLGLYLAFAANVGFREFVAAVLVAPIATTAAWVFASAAKIRFQFRFADIAQIGHVPWQVIVGTITIYKALAGKLLAQTPAASLLGEARFDRGNAGDLSARGRRALAITYTTLTPNSIVIDILEHPPRLLYHQIAARPLPPMTQNLGDGE